MSKKSGGGGGGPMSGLLAQIKQQGFPGEWPKKYTDPSATAPYGLSQYGANRPPFDPTGFLSSPSYNTPTRSQSQALAALLRGN